MTETLFGISSDAILSPCGKYRYTLSRIWDDSLPKSLWIMLNPSTADANKDDPTIRRCVGFAKAWGCGSLTVVNLFAFRATQPHYLFEEVEFAGVQTVGTENDMHIRAAVSMHRGIGNYIVAAWGAHAEHKALKWRVEKVLNMLPLGELYCLDYTKNGSPKHPLYCRADATTATYEVASK